MEFTASSYPYARLQRSPIALCGRWTTGRTLPRWDRPLPIGHVNSPGRYLEPGSGKRTVGCLSLRTESDHGRRRSCIEQACSHPTTGRTGLTVGALGMDADMKLTFVNN